jgi:hypothetical protein
MAVEVWFWIGDGVGVYFVGAFKVPLIVNCRVTYIFDSNIVYIDVINF